MARILFLLGLILAMVGLASLDSPGSGIWWAVGLTIAGGLVLFLGFRLEENSKSRLARHQARHERQVDAHIDYWRALNERPHR